MKYRKKSNESVDQNQHQQSTYDKGHVNPNFRSSQQRLSYANSFISMQENNYCPTVTTTERTSSLLEGRGNISDRKEANSYRNIETHPDCLDYPSNMHSTANAYNHQSNLSSVTPLNMRYMPNTATTKAKTTAPPINYRRESMASTTVTSKLPPPEMRSHIPWAFANVSTNVTTKINSEPWGYSSPHIPEPDYDTESLK